MAETFDDRMNRYIQRAIDSMDVRAARAEAEPRRDISEIPAAPSTDIDPASVSPPAGVSQPGLQGGPRRSIDEGYTLSRGKQAGPRRWSLAEPQDAVAPQQDAVAPPVPSPPTQEPFSVRDHYLGYQGTGVELSNTGQAAIEQIRPTAIRGTGQLVHGWGGYTKMQAHEAQVISEMPYFPSEEEKAAAYEQLTGIPYDPEIPNILRSTRPEDTRSLWMKALVGDATKQAINHHDRALALVNGGFLQDPVDWTMDALGRIVTTAAAGPIDVGMTENPQTEFGLTLARMFGPKRTMRFADMLTEWGEEKMKGSPKTKVGERMVYKDFGGTMGNPQWIVENVGEMGPMMLQFASSMIIMRRMMPKASAMGVMPNELRRMLIDGMLKGKLGKKLGDQIGKAALRDHVGFMMSTTIPAEMNAALESGFATMEAMERFQQQGMDEHQALQKAAQIGAEVGQNNATWTWVTGAVPYGLAQRTRSWIPWMIDFIMEPIQEIGEEKISAWAQGRETTLAEDVQMGAVALLAGAGSSTLAHAEGVLTAKDEDAEEAGRIFTDDIPKKKGPGIIPPEGKDVPEKAPDFPPPEDEEGPDTVPPEGEEGPDTVPPEGEEEDVVALADKMKQQIIDTDTERGEWTPEDLMNQINTFKGDMADEDFADVWDYAKQLSARESIDKFDLGYRKPGTTELISENDLYDELERLESRYPDLHKDPSRRPMAPSTAYGLARHVFTEENEEILDPMAGTGAALVGVGRSFGSAFDKKVGTLLKHSRGAGISTLQTEERDIIDGPDEAQRRAWGQVIVNPPIHGEDGVLPVINVGGGNSYVPINLAETAIWNALEYMRSDGKAAVMIPLDHVTQEFVNHLYRNYVFHDENSEWLDNGEVLMAVATGRAYNADALGPDLSLEEEEGVDMPEIRINPGFGGTDGKDRPVGGTRPRPGGVGRRPRGPSQPGPVPKPPSDTPDGDGGGTGGTGGGGTGGGPSGGGKKRPPRPKRGPRDGDTPDGPEQPGPDVPGEGEGDYDPDLPRRPGRKPRRTLTAVDRRLIAKEGPWAGREDQRVLGSQSIEDSEILEVFEFWAELTGYDGKLMVIDIGDITNQNQRRREGLATHGWDRPAETARELLDPQYGRQGTVALFGTFSGKYDTREDTEYGYIVINRPEEAKTNRFLFEVLAHEYGHALDRRMFSVAPEATKQAIDDGYAAWKRKVNDASSRGMTVKEFYSEFMFVGAPRSMALWRLKIYTEHGQLNSPISTLGDFFWKYVASRSEWMADQTARWMNTQAKPLTVLERFWDKMAQALKSFYGWIVKEEDNVADWENTPEGTPKALDKMSRMVKKKRTLKHRRERWFPDKSVQDWIDELAKPFDVRLADVAGEFGETPAQERRRKFEEYYKQIRKRKMSAEAKRAAILKKRAKDRETAFKKKRISNDGDGNVYQSPYVPMSESGGESMLTPTNTAELQRVALERVVEKHARPFLDSFGIAEVEKLTDAQALDLWVRHELGYDTLENNTLFGKFEDDAAAEDTFRFAFNGHQVDAIALAIAAHKDGGALVIGDQTGTGKGRVVAAFLVYASMQGETPIFMTDGVNLFNDMYSDLTDIGVVAPNIFTFNNEHITDRNDENIILQEKLPANTHKTIMKDLSKKVSAVKDFDFVFSTYSQIQNAGGAAGKRRALVHLAHSGTIMALDESHLVSGGDVQLGTFMRNVIQKPTPGNNNEGPGGVLYASATWVKRPDNMMLYSRTDMPIATAGNLGDLKTILKGAGDNMIEVVTGKLAEAGQYLRRERDLDGRSIPPEGNTSEPDEKTMVAQADRLNEMLRDMVAFDDDHMYPIKKRLDELVKAHARDKKATGSPLNANIAAARLSGQRSKILNNLLLALKADGLADEVLRAWREDGVKPVIASYETMEAFTQWYIEDQGLKEGDELVDFTFLRTVERTLSRSRRIVFTDQQNNNKGPEHEFENILDPDVFENWIYKLIPERDIVDPKSGGTIPDPKDPKRRIPDPNNPPKMIREQPFEGEIDDIKARIVAARPEYDAAHGTMESGGDILKNIPAAPVDYLLSKLKRGGMKIAELTGRSTKSHLEIDYTDPEHPVVRRVEALPKVKAIAGFNRDDYDGAFLNNAAATGMSMHQKMIEGVHDENNMPAQRWMFILQTAPDISAFMQIIGRVDRLGQTGPAKIRSDSEDGEWTQNNDGIPLYSQWTTPLLTEMRPIQMHMRKLKTLNAGTTASGKSAFDVEEVQNIENEYGDVVVTTYLRADEEIKNYILPRLSLLERAQLGDKEDIKRVPGIASLLVKELMYLPVEVQARAYKEIDKDYTDHIALLTAVGANELDTGVRELDAETLETTELAPATPGTDSPFGEAAVVETVLANKITLPYMFSRITMVINEAMDNVGIDWRVKQDPQWEHWDTEVFQDPRDTKEGAAAARKLLANEIGSVLIDMMNRIMRVNNEMLDSFKDPEAAEVWAELRENSWFNRMRQSPRQHERTWTEHIVNELREGRGATLAQYFTNPPPESELAQRKYIEHFNKEAGDRHYAYVAHMNKIKQMALEDRPEEDLHDDKIDGRIRASELVRDELVRVFRNHEYTDSRIMQIPRLGAIFDMNPDALTQQDTNNRNTKGIFIGLEYKPDKSRSAEMPPSLNELIASFAITPTQETAVLEVNLKTLSQNTNVAMWNKYTSLGNVRDSFEGEGAQNAREERYVVTGNLIAGYQALTSAFSTVGRPIVAYFTRADGSHEQGIIPPKGFSLSGIVVAGPPLSSAETTMESLIGGNIIRTGDYSMQVQVIPTHDTWSYKEGDQEVRIRVDARSTTNTGRAGGSGWRWWVEGRKGGYAEDIKAILDLHYPHTGAKQRHRVVQDFWFPQEADQRDAMKRRKSDERIDRKYRFNEYYEIVISKLAFRDIVDYAFDKGEGFREMSTTEKDVQQAFWLLSNPEQDPRHFFDTKMEEMTGMAGIDPLLAWPTAKRRDNPKAEDVISDETTHKYLFDTRRTQQRESFLERLNKKTTEAFWSVVSIFMYEAQTTRTKGRAEKTRGRSRKWWPDRIRRYQAHIGASFEEAAVEMTDVLRPLKDHDDFVKWKVYVEMRDLLERAKVHDNKMPMDLTVEAMEITLDETVRSMSPAQKRRVIKAVQNYWDMWNRTGDDLAQRGKLRKESQHKTYMPHVVLDYLRAEFSEALPSALRSPFRGYAVKADGSTRPTEDVLEASIRRIGQIKRHNELDDLIDAFVGDFGVKYKPGDLPREGFDFVELHKKRAGYPVMTITDRGIELATKVGMEAGIEEEINKQYPRGSKEYEEAMKAMKDGTDISIAWLNQNLRNGYWLPTHLATRVKFWRGEVGHSQPFVATANKVTQYWKAITIAKAATTSVHQLTNLIGDMENIMREDIFAPAHAAAAIAMLNRARKGEYDQDWRDALHEGVITSNWAHEELPDIVRKSMRKSKRLRKLEGREWSDLNPVKAVTKTYLDMMNARENVMRMALFLRRRKAGDSVKVAAKKAREAPVDYGRSTESERRFFSGMLFPFYTWKANNTINWLKYAKEHPAKFAAKMPLFFGSKMARFITKKFDPTLLSNVVLWYPLLAFVSAAAHYNESDDEKREIESLLPDWIKDQFHINLGMSTDGSPIVFTLSLSSDEFLDNFGGMSLLFAQNYKEVQMAFWGGIAEEGGSLVSPAFRVPAELYANKKVFSGAAVTPRYMVSEGGEVAVREQDRRLGGLVTSPAGAYALDSFFTPSRIIGQNPFASEHPELPHGHKLLGIRAQKKYRDDPETQRDVMRLADTAEELMNTGVKMGAAIRSLDLPKGVTPRDVIGEVKSREKSRETSAMTREERSDYFGGKGAKKDLQKVRSSAAFFYAQEMRYLDEGNKRQAKKMQAKGDAAIEEAGGDDKVFTTKGEYSSFKASIKKYYRDGIREEMAP